MTSCPYKRAVVDLDEFCDRVHAVGAVESMEHGARAIRFDSEDDPVTRDRAL